MSGTLTHDTSTLEEVHARLYEAGRKIDARQRVINQARSMAEVIREDFPGPQADQLLTILNKDPDQ